MLPNLRQQLELWLHSGDPSGVRQIDESGVPRATILLVGGGKLVDAVRELDQLHGLPEKDIHWACVDLMSHTARLVKQLLPGAAWLSTPDALSGFVQQLRSAGSSCRGGPAMRVAIVDPEAFYYRGGNHLGLPQSWATTSDSIAAALARELAADELVLLKSTDAPLGTSAEDWAKAGLVDEVFPQIAAQLNRCAIVNLRGLSSA